MMMSSTLLSWRPIRFLAAAIAVGILLVAFSNCFESFDQHQIQPSMVVLQGSNQTHHSVSHRKLLGDQIGGAGTKKKPVRISGESCTQENIVVNQKPAAPLPSGIPTFSVDIRNTCLISSCIISDIHLSCGSFASASLINPKVFRRVEDNDCIVNDGNTLANNGGSVSFDYANSFSYPLSVSHINVTC